MRAVYEVNLYIDGTLIGNISEMAQGLTWAKRRTKSGVDTIDFTVNDVILDNWCKARNTTLANILKPYALTCIVSRNGIDVIGGFLATMPGYSPKGTSADLQMRFDGWMNLLAGVYIYPTATQTAPMGALASQYIQMADSRATAAGKAFGFTEGTISTMEQVDQTFENYKPVKEFLTDRCDNTTGAGPFDVYWHPDKTYDVIKDSEFGDVISDYVIRYPAQQISVSATTISASEVSGFASKIIALGAGEVSYDPDQNTVITDEEMDSTAVTTYGYCENLIQESSISRPTTLARKATTELYNASNVKWEPQITLSGMQVEPRPNGTGKIWVGDTVQIFNQEDMTGQTSGLFRVNELSVARSAEGGEIITPVLERVV